MHNEQQVVSSDDDIYATEFLMASWSHPFIVICMSCHPAIHDVRPTPTPPPFQVESLKMLKNCWKRMRSCLVKLSLIVINLLARLNQISNENLFFCSFCHKSKTRWRQIRLRLLNLLQSVYGCNVKQNLFHRISHSCQIITHSNVLMLGAIFRQSPSFLPPLPFLFYDYSLDI